MRDFAKWWLVPSVLLHTPHTKTLVQCTNLSTFLLIFQEYLIFSFTLTSHLSFQAYISWIKSLKESFMSTPTLMLQVSGITSNDTKFTNLAYMKVEQIEKLMINKQLQSRWSKTFKKNYHVVVNDKLVVQIRYPILQLINYLFKIILLHSNAIN